MSDRGPDEHVSADLTQLRALLVCPACRGELRWSETMVACAVCRREYRVDDGIPVLVASSTDVDHDEVDHQHGPDGHNAGQAAWFDRTSAVEFEITRPRGAPALYEWLLRTKADRALGPIGPELAGATAVVACGGSGMDADFLVGRGARVISTDISLGAARRAQVRARRFGLPILIVVAAAERLPLADQAVDLSYVHDGLHHLEDPLAALDELARVASRWVSVTEPARAFATEVAVRAGLALDREDAGNLVRRMTPGETVGRLRHNGFESLRCQRYAMYYRHEPGRVARWLSRPFVLPLVTLGWRAANTVIGRAGNKLVVVGRRAGVAPVRSSRGPGPSRTGSPAGGPSVVAIFQSPTPYYTPILNQLADRVRLHVIYLGSGEASDNGASWTDFRDTWGEPPRFDRSSHPSIPMRVGRLDFHARFSLGIAGRLRRLQPEVIVVHSWGPLMVEPLVWARLARRRSVMWTESGAASGLLRDPVSMWVRRRLVGLADAVISSGSEATRFVQELGASPARTITSCLPSALGGVIAAQPIATAGRPADRERRFLFVGRLVARKRPLELARAFMRAAPLLEDATLTFVGDGPLQPSLESFAGRSAGRIRLVGRAEGVELADRFLAADVLVVPSVREVWGLVVNEGLAAGLFVIATSEVAAGVDLIRDESGLIVPPDDDRRLADALVAAAAADHSATAKAQRRALVSQCTPGDFAEAIDRAIELASRPRGGPSAT